MYEKFYTVSKSYTITLLFDQLCTMLAEHKWEDALGILPAVLLHVNDSQLYHFIWKAIHLIMIHMQVPQEKQINILQLMFKSNLKSYPVALEWFIEALQSTDHSCIKNYFQLMKQDVVHKRSEMLPAALFEAYMALFFYMQWKTKYNDLSKLSTNKDPSAFGQSSQEKEHMDLGVRILDRLNNSYVYFGKCNLYGDQAINESSPKLSNNKKIRSMCEWILAPLLDLEEKLNRSQEGNEELERRFGPSRLSGLEIVEEYSNTRQDHLPSLKLLYLYITKFHSSQEKKKLSVLKSISLLCPEEYLVLTYVEVMLQKELSEVQNYSFCLVKPREDDLECSQTLKAWNSQTYGSECLLSGICISTIKECVDKLTSFIEYLQWHKSFKAWHLLVTVLKLLQSSWTNCWDCKKCAKSRIFIEIHCSKLALWPEIFWNFSHISNSLEEKERILLIYRAYTSFIFGYNADIKHKVHIMFQNQDNEKLLKEVQRFFKLHGKFSDTFASYMKEQTSDRFQNPDQYFIQNLQFTNNEDLNVNIVIPASKKRKL